MMPTPRFRASLLVLSLAAAGFAGCSREPTAQEHLQAARAFLATKDHKAAMIELKNTLAQQPSNAEVRFLLGSSYLDLLEPAPAEIELRRALELGYDRVAVLAALSRSLSGQNKHQKALDELAAYRRERGSDLPPELLTAQGTAQLALGQTAQAKASLDAALRQAPTHAPAHLGLAWVAMAASDTDAALRHIEDSIRHKPDNADAWLFKGDTLRRKSLPKEAEAAYRQAVAVGSKDLRAHLRLIDLYSTLGRYEEARAEIGQVRKVEPQHTEAMYQLAALALKERKYAEADEAVQQVLKRFPDHALSMLVAGTAAHHLGKTEAADKYLSAYLKRDPNNVFARKLLAANFLQAKQPALALEAVAPLAVRSEDLTAVALAGTAALESRQFVKAVGYLERAVALAPKDAGLRTKLAASRMGLGETVPGLADLEAATRLDEKSSRPDVMLITTHLKRRDYDKALAAIAAMEKKAPRDPAVYNLRGLALEGKNDPAGARANFEKALSLQPDYFVAANNLAAQDLRAGNREAARERFTRLIEKNPRHVPAMIALANDAGAAGDDKGRLAWLEKAAKADPAALQPRVLLVRYHAEHKDFPKALTIAREVQSARPRDPQALNLLGAVQNAMGEKEAALTTYTSLARENPRSELAHFRLALQQVDAGDLSSARQSLGKALALQPNFLAAKAVLAAVETRGGRPAEAIKLARELRAQQPDAPDGAILEGDALLVQKDAAGASKAFAAAFEKAPTPEIFIKLHGALLQAGKAKEADQRAAEWLGKPATESKVRLYLAQIDLAAGRKAQAIAHYEAIVQSEPVQTVALNNLAWLYHQQGDARALPTAERAYKSRPGDAAVADTMGWILLQQGNVERGLPLLKEAAAKAPTAPALQYHLAAGYAKAGDKARARDTLDALLASKAAFPERAEATALRAQL